MILEKQTEAFIKQVESLGGPPIYKLSPEKAREVLEKVQSGHVDKPNVKIEEKMIPGGPKGEISVRIIRPEHVNEALPALLYFHGAGWVMGSASTHDRLVRELAVGANAAVVFVNYSRSPEVRFPVAIEESYTATKYIAEHGKSWNLDPSHLAIGGDSVGGNMAIAVSLLAKERQGPKIHSQLLFYPVTDSGMDTPSYRQYANGPWLTKPAMEYFWHAYEPDLKSRHKHLLSPIHSTPDQLKGLPTALVITAENDVLRDEGEQYAHKLMQAGVDTTAMRFLGTIHDFVLLNAIAKTPATRGAISMASAFLKKHFGKHSLQK